MTISLQSRALGKGLAEAVQRNKERTVSTITIYHDPRFAILQIIALIKHALCVLGGMSPSTTSVEIDEGSADLKAALSKSEHENQDLRRQLAALLTLQHTAPTSESKRWVPVRDAANIIGVHKQTIYRAIDQGRIATQSSKVSRKRNHMVDPTTYRKPPPKAKPRKRKSK